MANLGLYVFSLVLVGVSLHRDKARTKRALLKAWRSFGGILPQILGVIVLVGVLLALLSPEQIGGLIGSSTGWLGVVVASVVGAITLIPGFVAFPTAALLRENGAGVMQLGAFISSLMMVGVMTLPVEIRYFGRKSALVRNALAFAFTFLVALILGLVVGEV